MSERDFVLTRTARIESMLKQRGCEGTGMRAMAKSLKHYFSYDDWEELWWLGIQRNNFAHEEHPRLDDRARFERACERVTNAIRGIPMSPKHRFGGQSLFSGPPSRDYGYGRRRSQSPLGVVVALVLGMVMLVMFRGSHDAPRKSVSVDAALGRAAPGKSSINDFGSSTGGGAPSTAKPRPKRWLNANNHAAPSASASAGTLTAADLDDLGREVDAPNSDTSNHGAKPLDLKASDLDDF